MRTFWIAQWKTGLKRLKTFDTKEEAEYYRDNCSLNGSVEIFEVEEKKVADFEIAFGGYSNSDIVDELTATAQEKEVNKEYDTKCNTCVQYQFEANAQHWCDHQSTCKHSPNLGDMFTPHLKAWYEKDLGDGVWCRVWDNKKEHYDIVKIVKVSITSTLPYESRYTAWKHAEPVSKELAKLLDEEIK